MTPLIEKAREKAFGKRILPSKTAMCGYEYNVDKEVLFEDVDTFAKDLLEMARRETEVERPSIPEEEYISWGRGYNSAFSAVSAKWDLLLKK